jgi:hypothetical protein
MFYNFGFPIWTIAPACRDIERCRRRGSQRLVQESGWCSPLRAEKDSIGRVSARNYSSQGDNPTLYTWIWFFPEDPDVIAHGFLVDTSMGIPRRHGEPSSGQHVSRRPFSSYCRISLVQLVAVVANIDSNCEAIFGIFVGNFFFTSAL